MAEKEVTVAPTVEKKSHKMVWTLEKCKKAASRFTSREEWSQSAPSAYKAATARGWDAECCAHMTNLKPMKAVAAKSKAKVAKKAKPASSPRKSA